VPALSSSVLHKIVEFPCELGPDDLLGDRESGRRERALLEEDLEGIGPGEVLGVDVQQVRFINFTFSDECFGKLVENLRSGEHPDRFVVLIASEEDLEEKLADVAISLAARKLAMLWLTDPEDASDQRIVGELPKYLEDTLRAVKPGDTNEALAKRLGINLTTCNNRTDKLVKLRLLRRKLHEGGLGYKQWEFAPVLSPTG
jgi:hypothetical protein